MEMPLSLSPFKKGRLQVANQHALVGYDVTIPLAGWQIGSCRPVLVVPPLDIRGARNGCIIRNPSFAARPETDGLGHLGGETPDDQGVSPLKMVTKCLGSR